MKFENTRVCNFENSIRGARNPRNSWDRSDTIHEFITKKEFLKLDKSFQNAVILFEDKNTNIIEYINIGPNDLKLLTTLVKRGSSHRKFLRQIFVSVDITAPLYWWKEYDTYKVATVANSTPSSHTLVSEPINLDMFELDFSGEDKEYLKFWINIVDIMEDLRQKYNGTNDKQYWRLMCKIMPNSYCQKRTCTLNYETLLNMCKKDCRSFHRFNEWSGVDDPSKPNFVSWVRTLPYAQELIFYDEKND